MPDDTAPESAADETAGSAAHGRPAPSRTSLGLPPRRRGRPTGPTRVPVNVRLLLETDALVTEIADTTGQGLQDVIEAAVLHYGAYLRRTGKLPKRTTDQASAES